ncbi:MAG TPA: restriction endonuclease subunit S [Candidatus Udaeobacter sp.]|jgi:type I restriction enzyme S subunit
MRNTWPVVKLGDVLRRVERFEPRDELAEYQFAGTYSFARGIFVADQKSGSSFKLPTIQRVRAGDFIYCKIMAWEGAFGIAPPEADNCVMSGAFVVYEINRDRIDEKFLDYFFKVPAHWQRIGTQSTGTNVRRQNLHPSQFESAEVPLPPLAEQRRVVAQIEELTKQIEEARTLRKEAAEEVEALLSRATSQLLDDSGWDTTRLGEILAESPRNGLSPQQRVEDGGRGMLRINAVSSTPTRFVDMTAVKRVNLVDEVAEPFVVRNEDVFIVRYNGDINRVAKPAIYKGANESRVVFPDKLMRLRPQQTKMTPDFLVFALNARSVREQIEELGKTTAGNIGVSGRDAKSFKVPVPPLPEQCRIVTELDALQAEVDALKRLQAETAAQLDALLPSILDKAFKGEL